MLFLLMFSREASVISDLSLGNGERTLIHEWRHTLSRRTWLIRERREDRYKFVVGYKFGLRSTRPQGVAGLFSFYLSFILSSRRLWFRSHFAMLPLKTNVAGWNLHSRKVEHLTVCHANLMRGLYNEIMTAI